jgi:hypothetical protein
MTPAPPTALATEPNRQGGHRRSARPQVDHSARSRAWCWEGPGLTGCWCWGPRAQIARDTWPGAGTYPAIGAVRRDRPWRQILRSSRAVAQALVSQNVRRVRPSDLPPNAGCGIAVVADLSSRSPHSVVAVTGHTLAADGQFQMATDNRHGRQTTPTTTRIGMPDGVRGSV